MGIYGKENLRVNLRSDLVSEVRGLDPSNVAAVDSVVDDNAVQETAKQGMSVLGIPITHVVAAVAAIAILAAILLVGGLLNKKNKNNNPENYVDYEGNELTENNPLIIYYVGYESYEYEILYQEVGVKGEGWVKDIVTRLLNGNFDNSDVGYIKNLDDNIIRDCITVPYTVPNHESKTTEVRQAFTDLVKDVNNNSILNKDAFNKFNTTMQNGKAPKSDFSSTLI